MNYRILIVDDEELIREGIRVMVDRLKLFEGGIRTASNGTEALDIYMGFLPHIVLTDIRMEKMDGLEFIKKIREVGEKWTKIAIISGHEEFSYAKLAIRYGVSEYLLKPINRDEIAGLMDKLLFALKSEMPIVNTHDKHDDISQDRIRKPIVVAALEYIHVNFSHDLSLIEVSNHVNMNDSYFSTLFKKTVGLNFIDYLTNARIEKAKEYLKDPMMKVYEISRAVGYSGEKHFFKIFKKITGLTPNEYRRVESGSIKKRY